MPKRKSKSPTRGTPATPPGRVTREVSTGIYTRTTRRASTPEDMESMLRAMAERRDLDTLLDRIDVACQEHLKPHAKKRVQGPPEDVCRARECADHIRAIKHALARGDSRSAVYEAVQLGMAVERLGVLPWERHAARGAKVHAGAIRGHAEVHGTPEDKARRRETIQRTFAEVLTKAGNKRTLAYMRTAKLCKCHVTTVRRALDQTAK